MTKIEFDIIPINGKPVLKLPADFKVQWLAALRSGKYRQTDGYLHTDAGFCCLGVACDFQPANLWMEHGVRAVDIRTFQTETGSSTMPHKEDLPVGVYDVLHQPTDFAEQYPEIDHGSDLTDIGGGECLPSVMAALAGLNDEGYSFDDIADWIEANL